MTVYIVSRDRTFSDWFRIRNRANFLKYLQHMEIIWEGEDYMEGLAVAKEANRKAKPKPEPKPLGIRQQHDQEKLQAWLKACQ